MFPNLQINHQVIPASAEGSAATDSNPSEEPRILTALNEAEEVRLQHSTTFL